ncbi:MAG: hypothetical protein KF764_12350 [Labilithrix sp.]|nr:hypothetical protein [Labilithrix sp.]
MRSKRGSELAAVFSSLTESARLAGVELAPSSGATLRVEVGRSIRMADAGIEQELHFASEGVAYTRLEAARVASTIAKSLLVLAFEMAGVGRLLLGELTPACVALLSVIAVALFITSYSLSLGRRSVPGTVSAGSHGLHATWGKRARSFAVEEIASALVVRRSASGATRAFVEIGVRPRLRALKSVRRRGGDMLSLQAPDDATAARLVELLGFGRSGRRVSVSLALPERRLLHLVLGAISYATGLAFVVLVGTALPVEGLLAYLYGIPASAIVALLVHESLKAVGAAGKVTVGCDGIEVKRGLHQEFLVRRDLDITRVRLAVETALRGGLGGLLLDPERRDAVVGLVRASENEDEVPPSRLRAYEREGRTLADWSEHVRTAVNVGDYRSGALVVDEAAAIVVSPSATVDQRIGAALALRLSETPAAQIRDATEGIADGRLREAILAINDAEHEPDIVRILERRGWSR